MKCPMCSSDQVYQDEYYETIYRCSNCNYTDNKKVFEC